MLRYLFVYQRAFETGVALGYAYRRKITAFARLLCAPGHEVDLVAFMHQLAENRVVATSNMETLFDLGMRYEGDRIKSNWKESGITESEVHAFEMTFKLPAETVWKNIHIAPSAGIGFGSGFPDQTEQLWHNTYGPITLEELNRGKAVGLFREEETLEKGTTLEEAEAELVPRVEAFLTERYPELVAELTISV